MKIREFSGGYPEKRFKVTQDAFMQVIAYEIDTNSSCENGIPLGEREDIDNLDVQFAIMKKLNIAR